MLFRSANAPWSAEAAATIASGIAWYPVCNRTEDGAVPLGPFTRPVLFLEGTGDTATPPEVCADLASEPGNRAAVYAEAADVQLGNIVSIEDTEQRGPQLLAAGAPMARSVQVTPPENLTLSASVTMTWRITGKP